MKSKIYKYIASVFAIIFLVSYLEIGYEPIINNTTLRDILNSLTRDQYTLIFFIIGFIFWRLSFKK